MARRVTSTRSATKLARACSTNHCTFSTDRAGLFNLTGGTKTLGIYKDWGFHDVDYLEFRPFTPPAIQPISAQLSDPLANQNTQMLMNYLTGIYGQKTLAGHQHDGSKNLPFPSSTYLNLSGGLKAGDSRIGFHGVFADANSVWRQPK